MKRPNVNIPLIALLSFNDKTAKIIIKKFVEEAELPSAEIVLFKSIL